MALNYSHSPVFQTHIYDDNLVSPVRIVNGYLVGDVPDKNGESYLRPWHMIPGEAEEWNFNCRRIRTDTCSSLESTSNDIVDLLPSDPFGMDIQTTFTAITGWLEDLELDYGGYMRTNNCLATQEGYSLFDGWNMFCNNALKYQPFPNNNGKLNGECSWSSFQVDEKLKAASAVDERGTGVGLAPFDIGFEQSHDLGHAAVFNGGSTTSNSKHGSSKKVEVSANSAGVPHQALSFVLGYLGLKDLLSVEMVCKSLFSSVRGDPFLWAIIHIDRPLNERITDDVLVQLASRAQGNLHCLSLVECSKITDESLRRILETNTQLTKLCVPGCTRINITCIVDIIKEYNSNQIGGGIKSLRIGGLCGVNLEHFEELKLVLGVDNMKLKSHHKPLFYHRGSIYLPYDDDRAIDIEVCPRCEKFRLVYDCPAEGCKVKDGSSEACRACTFCIARCAQCGRCINDTEFEETFCLELLCSDCFKQMLSYQDTRQEG